MLFDKLAREQKVRRAKRIANPDANFLSAMAAETIADRLTVVNRHFGSALDYESIFDCMADRLHSAANVESVFRLGGLSLQTENIREFTTGPDGGLPLASVELVTSVFGLHWMNDLPGTLLKIRNALKPDGLFMAALPGDQTLKELRSSLVEAESNLTGNASLRVDPFGEVRQYGALLQRAGFALPVVDTETVTVRYRSLARLVTDLRSWGGTRSLASAAAPPNPAIFRRAEQLYFEKFSDPDGKIRVSFEIVYLLGWAPHHSQQKPLAPGSGKINLGDVLGNSDPA